MRLTKHKASQDCFLRSLIRERDGSTAVIIAIGVSVLAGMWALSMDLGRAWNLDTELQNAADAAALACASQLDQKAGARTRARLAAMGGLVQNTQTFASDGAGANVTIAAGDIKFLVDLTTRAEATSDGDANYCEVTAGPRTVDFSFAQLVLAQPSVSPEAVAVAELSSARCAIPPIFICNPEEPNPFDAVARAGFGITLKSSTGGGLAAGNFGLLALPAQPNALLSANQIRDAWARVKPKVQCFAKFVTTKPGQTTAIKQGLNMRFDIFFMGNHQVPAGEFPVKENKNYTPSMNSVKGLTKAGAQCSYTHPQGWNKTAQPYEGAPPSDALGFPRDACAYNGGSCDTYAGGTNLGDGIWDAVTYMDVNHPGSTLNDVPDLNGITEPTGKSRYEVYEWEKATPNNLATAPLESPAPICHTDPEQTALDRRVIYAAVVNCGEIAGTTEVVPDAWIGLFLTEPMGVYDGNNDLYGEFIGPADEGNDVTVRYILRLVE